ncbi:MAG: ABC transporter ATP-binding protein [Richelia sp. SM2_1_7]|nr:ABC transporter ATP-binding protein [Richelia sp. SM2_1_7]
MKYRELQLQGAAINNHLQETLSNIKLIKSSANEEGEIDRFSQINQKNMQANLRTVQLWSAFAPVIDFMNNLGHIIILAYGSWEVIQSK